MLARAANVPLDAPTSTPDAGGAGVQGVDSALGPVGMLYIRAPRIQRVGTDVQVLATYRGEPVLVRPCRGCTSSSPRGNHSTLFVGPAPRSTTPLFMIRT